MTLQYPNLIGECPTCIEEAGFKYVRSVEGARGDIELYRCDSCSGICDRKAITEKKQAKSLGFLVEGGEGE